MLNSIKLLIKSNYFLFKAVRFLPAYFGFYKRRAALPLDDFWKKRVEVVVSAPDNAFIPRVPDAGRIVGDVQLMHNGLKINVGSYYGDGNTVLLYKNRGVHEPQEEKVFDEILNFLPQNAVMVELGSFWAFYSMSFLQRIKQGRSYLIEPDPHSLLSGKNNFRLNNFKGRFFNYYISDSSEVGTIPTISIDEFLEKEHIEKLNILHSDIQGYELKMLQGAVKSLGRKAIDYFFISTHSNELHDSCKSLLVKFEYEIMCDANLDETYSWDGLIVARHKSVGRPAELKIHKKAAC
jgi:hypothetical protein